MNYSRIKVNFTKVFDLKKFNLFFLCLSIIFYLLITPSFLDLYLKYTQTGGFFFEKLHPALYITFFSFVLSALIKKKIILNKKFLFSFILFFCLCIYLLIIGQYGTIAMVIDSYFFPILLIMMIIQTRDYYYIYKNIFLLFLFSHNFFLIIELINSNYMFIHYAEWSGSSGFRPVGLSDHPTNSALLISITALFLYLSKIKFDINLGLIFILLFIAIITGTRSQIIFVFIIFLMALYELH